MPQYKVTDPGFFGGKRYGAGTRRHVLTVDAPFTKKNMPSWIDPDPIGSNNTVKKTSTKNPPPPPKVIVDGADNTEADSDNGVETL